MNIIDIIRSKRDGETLSTEAIQSFISDYTKGKIQDYHASALLMAILLRGMNTREVKDLTQAMLQSGKVLSTKGRKSKSVDKHSTGGVGDKVSLCLAPWVAACGVQVPMISGRGLGHTGGTLDKLESITGMDVRLSEARFQKLVNKYGLAFGGQTANIAPADRKLYSLRDVTGTVESIPLIVASILSKKLAEGLDGLVLDVKVGQGAFMKDLKQAEILAKSLVTVAQSAGVSATAFLTQMNEPLGRAIGNANEVREAVEILKGKGPSDLKSITETLATEMLLLGGAAKTKSQASALLRQTLESGAAYQRFIDIVREQGGDVRQIEKPSLLPKELRTLVITAPQSGYVSQVDALALAKLCSSLGAGRQNITDSVNHGVGFEVAVKVGDKVERSQLLISANIPVKANAAEVENALRQCFSLKKSKVEPLPLILKKVSR